jgi:hypothetical protein
MKVEVVQRMEPKVVVLSNRPPKQTRSRGSSANVEVKGVVVVDMAFGNCEMLILGWLRLPTQ